MKESDSPISISYYGWSGFRIEPDHKREILLDPTEDMQPTKGVETIVILSHGHPEHVAGTMKMITDGNREQEVAVIASPAICRFLEKRSKHAKDTFYPSHPARGLRVHDIDIEPFEWRHMSLLPPEITTAIHHLGKILTHPFKALQIIRNGWGGPPFEPMLGYRITPPEGPSFLFYSEGLHRKTRVEEIEYVSNHLPADVLIAGIEPEDISVYPDLVKQLAIPQVIPYQPHLPWRKGFGMAEVDMHNFCETLDKNGFTVYQLQKEKPCVIPSTYQEH